MYFDGVLIYSKTLEHHMDHLSHVCRTSRKEKLYANPKKCVFMTDQVIILGFVVSPQAVSAESQKIHAIVEWSEPRKMLEVFMGQNLLLMIHKGVQHYHSSNYRLPEERGSSVAAAKTF